MCRKYSSRPPTSLSSSGLRHRQGGHEGHASPPYSISFRLLRCVIFSGHESGVGPVSRVTPVHTAMRNCTRDEGGPFEVGNQVLISNHRKLLWSKAMVVNVAEKPEQESGRYD